MTQKKAKETNTCLICESKLTKDQSKWAGKQSTVPCFCEIWKWRQRVKKLKRDMKFIIRVVDEGLDCSEEELRFNKIKKEIFKSRII